MGLVAENERLKSCWVQKWHGCGTTCTYTRSANCRHICQTLLIPQIPWGCSLSRVELLYHVVVSLVFTAAPEWLFLTEELPQSSYQLRHHGYQGPRGMESYPVFFLNSLLHKTVIVKLWQRLGSGDAQTKSHSLCPRAVLFHETSFSGLHGNWMSLSASGRQ